MVGTQLDSPAALVTVTAGISDFGEQKAHTYAIAWLRQLTLGSGLRGPGRKLLRRGLTRWLTGPGSDKGYKGNDSLRRGHLSLNSFTQRREVTNTFERKILSLDLWQQTAKKIVGPSRKVWITTEQHFHPHRWRGQRGFLEKLIELNSYLCLCPCAAQDLMDQGSRRRPERQARGNAQEK